PQGTVIADAEHRIVTVNPAFEKITGYRAADVEGREMAVLTGDGGAASAIWDCVRTKGGWQGEFQARRSERDVYRAWLNVSAVRNDSGDVSNYIALISDVTERNLAETKVRRLASLNAILSRANQLIARGPEPEVLFDSICRSIVYHSDITLAWIHPVPGTGWTTAPVSSCNKHSTLSGKNEVLSCAVDSHCVPVPAAGLPCAGLHRCMDVQAGACFAIRRDGVLVGALTIHTEDADFFDESAAMLLDRLANDITFALDTMELERCRRAAEERLAYLATHDSLTDLHRRPALEEVLAREHAAARRRGTSYSIALIDIDNFKVINDSYGHAAGDEVLVRLSAVLKDSVRTMDWVARWGGEEFLCLLPDAASGQAVASMGRLQERLAEQGIPIGGRNRRITVSIGVATFPCNGGSTSELLAAADAALYQAKDRGGDCVVQAGDSPGIFLIGARIEEALEDRRVRAAYQPIVSLADGRPVADEALARLVLPDDSVAEAGTFIESATRLYLIHRIDQAVMEQAMVRCARERTGTEDGRPARLHFVNASSALLCRADLVDTILERAARHCGSDARAASVHKRFVIEVTERALMSDPEAAHCNLDKLRSLGFQIALDDFGSGYSSFLYLLELPVSFLKIEQQLARQVCADRRAAAIVQGITEVARRLQIKTIAEGIEDADTAAALQSLGVDWGQGYYYGKPQLP
ncbi:MAG TPA: EAL domain-containing protein, partial [Gammaproteobacteria bacterium]|nr:EAL domain-containing protein [Gammaproteobacteria bacterium]